jgi:hypothetical membrane protein
MVFINIAGLTLFLLYIPIFVVILFKSTRIWGGYRITRQAVSELGISHKKSAPLFNLAIFLYGFLSIFLAVNIHWLYPSTASGALSLFILSTGVCTALVGFLPMDQLPNLHSLVGMVTFLSVICTALTSSIIIIATKSSQAPILVINLSILIFVPLYAYGAKWGSQAKIKLAKKIVKEVGLWEWVAVVLTAIWNFSYSYLTLVVLLSKLK